MNALGLASPEPNQSTSLRASDGPDGEGPGQGGKSRQTGVEGAGRRCTPPQGVFRTYRLLGVTSELKLHHQPLATPLSFDVKSKPYSSSSGTSGRMTDLIVKSGVKDSLESYYVSADLYEALDEEVRDLLEDAARRADANDRKTVQPQDL